jgi:tellurite resistance protein TerC
MISAGAVVIQSFHRVLLLFAAVLVYQGVKILRNGGNEDDDDDEDGEDDADLSGSAIVQLAHRLVPVSEHYDGSSFFVREGVNGQLMATPLLLVLVVIEMSDVVFAIDSVPAAFGTCGSKEDTFTSSPQLRCYFIA